LKGEIFVGCKKVEFNIKIPNYQRFLRLNIYICWDEDESKKLKAGDKLKVFVKDADFNLKADFYNAAVPYRINE
jgi:hypothetical protein